MKRLPFNLVVIVTLIAMLIAGLFSGACHCRPHPDSIHSYAACKEIVDSIAIGVLCISVLARASRRGRLSLCPLLTLGGIALAFTGLCFGAGRIALGGIALLDLCTLITSALETRQAANDLRRARLRISRTGRVLLSDPTQEDRA